jgi:hypothetical protein
MAELFVSGGIVTALEDAAVAVGRLDAALAGNGTVKTLGVKAPWVRPEACRPLSSTGAKPAPFLIPNR